VVVGRFIPAIRHDWVAVSNTGSFGGITYKSFTPHTPPMDEALEVIDVLADSELEGAITWLFRLLGVVAVLAGLGLWLFTDTGLLFVPAALIVLGLVLFVAPSILLAFAELAG
jgi:hypothetical protein